MTVCGDLRDSQRDLFHSTGLGQNEAVSLMDWNAAPEVWQGERRLSVTAVGGSDQLEQSLVFRNWQQLPLAEHPTSWCEVTCKHPNFANIGLSHGFSP
jgi:hypothetical protein